MKNRKMQLFLPILACLIPFAISLIYYEQLPSQIATHWDAQGTANGYSSRFFAAFGLPAIMLAVTVFTQFILNNDPKRRNMSTTLKSVAVWLVPILSIIIQSLTIYNALSKPINIFNITTLFLGILFMVIGNYLPKCKQNYSMGIRLPWTLNSENNWNKTHQLAGYVWVASGLLVAATSFFGKSWIQLTIIGAMVLIPSVYSYCYYLKERQQAKH